MKYYYDTGVSHESVYKFRPMADDADSKFIKESFVLLTKTQSDAIKESKTNGFDFMLNDLGVIICATSDCDGWNSEGQCFDLDKTAKRIEVKETHKATVNTATDTIRDGWLLCDTDPTPGAPALNKSFLGNEFNRNLLSSKQNVIQRKTAEVASEFPSLWVKTGKGDNDEYEILASEVEPMYDAVEFTTQALVNLYVEVKNTLILVDFADETLSLDDFEAKDYVNMTGGFMELFATKTADAKIYAQPEDEPSAL